MSRLVKLSMLAAAVVFAGGALQAVAHGHRADGPDFAMARLGKLHDQLKLTPEQEGLWRQAEEKTRETAKQMRASRDKVRDALKQELAKSEPDLAAVASIADQAQEDRLKARHEVRDLWLKLYAGLSPQQKAVAADFLRDRLARAEHFREKIKERYKEKSKQAPAPGPAVQ
jgi:protein CpxP